MLREAVTNFLQNEEQKPIPQRQISCIKQNKEHEHEHEHEPENTKETPLLTY